MLFINFSRFHNMSLAKFLNKSIEQSQQLKRVCLLKPKESEHQTIQLQSGKNEIGRSKETGIRDVRCSKRQLIFDVNLEKCQINLQVLGVNPCSLNGFMVNQGTKTVAQHGDVIEIVYGRHPFEIIFKPPPPDIKPVIKEDDQTVSNGDSLKDTWEVIDNGKLVIFNSKGLKSSNKIAGYDMDGTIITTKSGNVFPKNTDDWQILHPDISTKLKQLTEECYKICFFTNQGGIATGKVKLEDFKQKIRGVVGRVGVPVQVFIAVGEGFYRKPVPGMWNYLSEHKNDGVRISLNDSFYVGDAAGRDAEGKRKRDHSSCDRLFALNVGLPFFTPEEHFFNKKPSPWNKPGFDPTNFDTNVVHLEPKNTKIPSAQCELIIVVGLPGSGKSIFSKSTLEPHGYTIINADSLGSVQACVKRCEKSLQAGKSCVIDNTNVDVESRKKFLDIAKLHGVPCRCFVMNLHFDQVKHNIAFRHLTDPKHSKINPMVMNTFKKKYTNPSLDEGFTDVVKVNLNYEFKSAEQEKLYKLFLVEK